MEFFSVKDNGLLVKSQMCITKKDLEEKIQSLIGNLIKISDDSGEFLIRLDDGRVIDSKGWDNWEWPQGVGLYGLWQYYAQSGNKNIREIIVNWFSNQFSRGTPIKNVNTISPVLTLAYLYEDENRREWLTYIEQWADWVMNDMPRTNYGGLQHINSNRENNQQLWDDTLMMCALPLAKAGTLLNRPEYIDEAVYQFMLHAQQLMDPKTGLWFHGWTFEYNHNFANALWARGNCWITIAIPDLLELLPRDENNPIRRYLIQLLQQQVDALKYYQNKNGLWHTLLNDPDSYLEASATAGFAYGILKGVRMHYLHKDMLQVAERAISAITDRISPKGELQQVSFGTAVGSTLQFYKDIPLTSMPYGQSLAIMALAEYRRLCL